MPVNFLNIFFSNCSNHTWTWQSIPNPLFYKDPPFCCLVFMAERVITLLLMHYLLNDIIDINLLSLNVTVLAAPSCVFYAIRKLLSNLCEVLTRMTWFSPVLWFGITHEGNQARDTHGPRTQGILLVMPPLFRTTTSNFTNPALFMGNFWTPSLSGKISKTQPLPLYPFIKGKRGLSYAEWQFLRKNLFPISPQLRQNRCIST